MEWNLRAEERAPLIQLVEHDVIRLADERLAATRDRVVQARVNRDAALDAHKAAEATSARAVAGEGDLSPIDAEQRLETAARELSVAEKVFMAATKAAEEASEARQRAKVTAWQPVYLAGIQRRIQAAKKADEARAMLAEAEREHWTGTAIMQHAYANDVPHPTPSAAWNQPLRTEEDERRIWGLERADPAAGWTVHAAMGRNAMKDAAE